MTQRRDGAGSAPVRSPAVTPTERSSSADRPRPGRWAVWLLIVLGAAVALAIASRSDGGPATAGERTQALAARVRCPVCTGLSVADSKTSAARAIHAEIARRVGLGQRDEEIIGYLTGSYGDEILLNPKNEGVAALVWALPVVGFVLGAGAVVHAFRRGRPRLALPTDDDTVLVERALVERALVESARSSPAPSETGE